jgi:hypothetical protein
MLIPVSSRFAQLGDNVHSESEQSDNYAQKINQPIQPLLHGKQFAISMTFFIMIQGGCWNIF